MANNAIPGPSKSGALFAARRLPKLGEINEPGYN